MSQSSKLWHCDIWKCHKMSQNVTLFQIFGTKLRLPFMFGSGSERLLDNCPPLERTNRKSSCGTAKHCGARAPQALAPQKALQDSTRESCIKMLSDAAAQKQRDANALAKAALSNVHLAEIWKSKSDSYIFTEDTASLTKQMTAARGSLAAALSLAELEDADTGLCLW